MVISELTLLELGNLHMLSLLSIFFVRQGQYFLLNISAFYSIFLEVQKTIQPQLNPVKGDVSDSELNAGGGGGDLTTL